MTKKNSFTILLVSAILLISATVAYNYIYKKHRNIKTENASFSITTAEILNEFSINPTQSEKKYLNKTIEISGTITEKSQNTITLDHIVFCQFSNSIKAPLNDKTHIIVKGRFIGYDDLLEEIKLDQCLIN